MAGIPQQIIPFQKKTIAASGSYSDEISGGHFGRVFIDLSGEIAHSGAPAASPIGPAAMLGDVRITQNSTPVFSALGSELHLITRHMNGTAFKVLPTSASPVTIGARLDLNFNAMLPGAGYDASGNNRFGLRFDARPASACLTTGTTATLNVEPAAEHFGGQVGTRSVSVPRWSWAAVDASTKSTNKVERKTFDRPGVLLGVAFSAVDKGATDAADVRRNNIISRIRMKLIPSSGGGMMELADLSWKALRYYTDHYFRVPEAQSEDGFAIWRFQDAGAPALAYGLAVGTNDTLEINIDNAGAIDPIYGGAYAAAAGDEIRVTYLFFETDTAGRAASRFQRGTNPVAGQAATAALSRSRVN